MREPGEGLMHGVRLIAPGSRSEGGGHGGSPRHMMECASTAEALAWLCVVVENVRLRTAWGLHVSTPPLLEITPQARQGHFDLERFIATVRRDLPDVAVTGDHTHAGTQAEVASNTRVPSRDQHAAPPPSAGRSFAPSAVRSADVSPPRSPGVLHRADDQSDETDDDLPAVPSAPQAEDHTDDPARGEGDALTREEVDMLLGRHASGDPDDQPNSWENA